MQARFKIATLGVADYVAYLIWFAASGVLFSAIAFFWHVNQHVIEQKDHAKVVFSTFYNVYNAEQQAFNSLVYKLRSLSPAEQHLAAELITQSHKSAPYSLVGFIEQLNQPIVLENWVPKIRFVEATQMPGVLVTKAERVVEANSVSEVIHRGSNIGFDYSPDFTNQILDKEKINKPIYITVNQQLFVVFIAPLDQSSSKQRLVYKMMSLDQMLLEYVKENNLLLDALSLTLAQYKRLVLTEGKSTNIPFVSSDEHIKLSIDSLSVELEVRVPVSWSEKSLLLFITASFIISFLISIFLLLSNIFKQRSQQLFDIAKRYGELLDNSHEGVVLLDQKGEVQYWSRTASALFGYSSSFALSKSVVNILFDDKTGHKLKNILDYNENFKMLSYLKTKSGDYLYCKVSVSYFVEVEEIVLTIEDITKQYEDDKTIKRLAFYDSLTGLESRSFFCMQVSKLISDNKITNGVLLFLDLDGFKSVNDQMGHEAGDQLLTTIATRLKQAVLQVTHDMHISRFGGDEFVIFIYNTQFNLEKMFGVIQKYVTEPVVFSGAQTKVSTSMGVAVYPDHAQDFDSLLRNADIAMYAAKAMGKNSYRLFDESMVARIQEKLLIRQKLADAIVASKLEVYYQPLIDISAKKVYGAEALVRWHDADLGWVSPAKFIPIAEEYGLITDVTRWVVDVIVGQLKIWDKQTSFSDIKIAVNIGPNELNRDDFIQFLYTAFKGIEHLNARLDFELTEYSLMSNIDDKLPLFDELRSQGFGISIDDFGTGYSSLSYLKKLPISKLKIDQTFVKDLPDDEEDMIITQTIINMAKSLGIKVVAEGVEKQDQWDFLVAAGCDYIQGYLASKPLPLVEFEPWLIDYNNKG
jgi:diguanylate cyclase (GGDEF)-like protein/PAS domain S-box-containing protein